MFRSSIIKQFEHPQGGEMIRSVDNFHLVPARLLNCDQSYQRIIVVNKVKRIVNNFDQNLFSALLVARRPNGTLWVIDGQHRLLALIEKNKGLDFEVECKIINVDTIAEERRLFEVMNNWRNVIDTASRVKNKLYSRDEKWVNIKALVDIYGFELQFAPTPSGGKKDWRCIYDHAALLDIANQPRDLLGHTLSLIKLIWFRQPQSTSGSMLRGVAYFIRHYGDSDIYIKALEDGSLVERLKKVPVDGIRGLSRTFPAGDSEASRYALAICKLYDLQCEKKRHRLLAG